MERNEITELDQRLLTYALNRLYEKYNTVEDLVRMWKLFGPCLEWCPRPEIRKPWLAGLNLTDSPYPEP